jgi:hypothetical protein
MSEQPEKVYHRFGLELTDQDFADLKRELDKVDEAEREAWRNLT